MGIRRLAACATLILPSVLLAGPAREPDQTMIYPHGALIQLALINGDLVAFSGWTRGYGIMTFDIADPDHPKLKSGVVLPGYVNAPVRKGDTMYIPSLFGLFVLDMSGDRLALERNLLMDFSPKSGPGRSAVVAGDKLLVVGNAAKRLFDISNPSAPLLEKYDFVPDIKNIQSDGERFFIFNGATISMLSAQGELTEVSPTLATPIKAVMTAGDGANRMLLVQDRKNVLTLYAATGNTLTERAKEENVLELRKTSGGIFMKTAHKLRLLEDVTRGTLTVAREFAIPREVSPQFEFDGKHFYVMAADYNRSISILDASSPELRVRATIPVCRSDGGLEVTEDAIYLGSGNALLAFDKRKPDPGGRPDQVLTVAFAVSPDPQQSRKSFGAYNLLSPYGIRRFGNYLLFSGALIDIRKPLAPVFAGIATAPCLGISLEGIRAAFAQGHQVSIADLSKMPEVTTLGTYARQTNQGPMLDVILRGNRLYAIDTRAFYVFDASDPAAIKLLDTKAADSPCAIASVGDTLYIPSGITGERKSLLIYAAETGAITDLEEFIREGVSSMVADGDRLFLGDGTVIRQFDVSDPLKPLPVAEYTSNQAGGTPDQPANFTELQIDGDRLYARKYSRVNAWKIVGKGEK
jgi:hypothetical protein